MRIRIRIRIRIRNPDLRRSKKYGNLTISCCIKKNEWKNVYSWVRIDVFCVTKKVAYFFFIGSFLTYLYYKQLKCRSWVLWGYTLQYFGRWVAISEYTLSGDCRFLAYIPSWWKNQPWLVRVGPTPFQHITIMFKVAVYAPAEWQIHSPCSSSTNTYMYSV